MKFNSNRGFTLFEIAVAIGVLGLGLSTLIALQSTYSKMYTHERNLSQAALYAQYLMTFVEAKNAPPEAGDVQSSVYDALEKVDYFESDEKAEAQTRLAGWDYSMNVTSVDLLNIKDALRRVEILVVWGDRPGDRFSLVYYLRIKAQRGAT